MAGLDQLIQIIRENRRAEQEDKRLDYALASENLRLMYQRDLEKDKMDFQQTTVLWNAARQDLKDARTDYDTKVETYNETYGKHLSLDDLNITKGYDEFISGAFDAELTMDEEQIDDYTKQMNAYKTVTNKLDTVMKTKLSKVDDLFVGKFGF